MKKAITVFILALLSVSYADLVIPTGDCQNLTLINQTDFSNYSESVCGGRANLNITLFANETNNTFYDAASNSTFTALGNQTVRITLNITENITQNVTNLACPPANATYWANSTNTINNATIACLSNTTAVPFFFNFSADFTPTGADQVIDNATGIRIRVFAIPSNYCHENASTQLGQLGLYRSDRTNTTVSCIVENPLNVTCPPQKEVFCPDTVTDCSNEVGKVVSECSTRSAAASETSNNTIMDLTFRKNSAEQRIIDLKNATDTGRLAAKDAVDEQLWPVPWLLLSLIAIAVIAIAGVLYYTSQERKFHSSDLTPPALTKEEERQMGNAGTEKNIWDGEHK